jgi:DNA polymerase-1
MILQVHDELVFEVENDKVDLAKKEIARLMDTAANIGVPITVDIGSGDNWSSAH